MVVIDGNTFSDIYQKILNYLMNRQYLTSEICSRGKIATEIENLVIVLRSPLSNIFKNEVRQPNYKYLAGELIWYFSGKNDLESISKYSKFWNKITDDPTHVNSAYGYLIFKEKNKHGISEWEWAYNSLVKDKFSRQSIIHFSKPDNLYFENKDVVCTLTGTFHIRNNSLNFTVIMRSQDEILGRTYDLPFFTLLQQQMLIHLLPHYPNLQLGYFMQLTHSAHIYEQHYELASNMLKTDFIPDSLPPMKNSIVDNNGNYNYTDSQLLETDEFLNWLGVHS